MHARLISSSVGKGMFCGGSVSNA